MATKKKSKKTVVRPPVVAPDAGSVELEHGDRESARTTIRIRAVLERLVAATRAKEITELIGELTTIARDGDDGSRPVDQVLGDLLAEPLDRIWENGWQPADLPHVATTEQGPAAGELAAAVVLTHAEATGAFQAAPADWVGQLTALRETTDLRQELPLVTAWALSQGSRAEDGWRDGVGLLRTLRSLPRLTTMTSPPSDWAAQRRREAAQQVSVGVAGVDHEPGLLDKIRALLAKAESTNFPAEAELFTAKAQDLMTRYAVDELILHGDAPTAVRSRRVLINEPYGEMKVQLLTVIAEVNRVRTVWDSRFGMASLVGEPLDLDLVLMLHTSLLIQATRAMTGAGADSAHSRTPAYRRAFLLAYAHRISERLAEVSEVAEREAAGDNRSALVSLRERRSAEVDTVFDTLFPQTKQLRTRMVDVGGWNAGRTAADAANLGR